MADNPRSDQKEIIQAITCVKNLHHDGIQACGSWGWRCWKISTHYPADTESFCRRVRPYH